jgi:RNA polymerase sigma factor (TIGR02999 family)
VSDHLPNITLLLEASREGNREALDELLAVVYGELRALAARYLGGEKPGQTLQPTALVHEAYLRLVGNDTIVWRNRAHFFSVAAKVMRHVLVDGARSKARDKRGGGALRVTLDESVAGASDRTLDLVRLDDALSALERVDPRKCRVVEMRYFAGLTIDEAAEALGVSAVTVTREWTLARAWLRRELEGEEAP